MKKIISVLVLLVAMVSCDKMDDNYKEYLERERTYSPKVKNLTADVGLRIATLNWENPQGSIAKKIFIDYEDGIVEFETMVNTATLENLKIKGYDISVYTVDAYGNRSVPETITIFPNGE